MIVPRPGGMVVAYARKWQYGDLMDWKQIGSIYQEAVVMFIGESSENTSWVVDLMKGYPFEALNMELAPISPPSMLAGT